MPVCSEFGFGEHYEKYNILPKPISTLLVSKKKLLVK